MVNQQHRPRKLRAVNGGPKTPVAQNRKALYRCALTRVSEAVENGYCLEAITLLESLIADRLESRTARIHDEADEKRIFSNIRKLVDPLAGKNSPEPEEAKNLYREIAAWSGRRNEAIHEFAKLAENHELTWEQKYEAATKAAHDGLQLFRRLDGMVRKLNRKVKSD